MSLSFYAKMGAPAGALMAAENFLLRPAIPLVYAGSSLIPALPKAYGAMLFVNVVSSSYAMITLGGRVGKARSKSIEAAKLEGDKDAEDRYSYPKLYAEGFSKTAKLFNCIQRGHQQALETYPSFVALSLIAGIKYPITAAIGGVIWHFARFAWAEGYATGDPSKRYQSFLAVGIWSSLFIELIGATATIVSFVM